MTGKRQLADGPTTDGTADGCERSSLAATELMADHAASNCADDGAGNLMLVVWLALFGHGLVRTHLTRPGHRRYADDASVLRVGIGSLRRAGRSVHRAMGHGAILRGRRLVSRRRLLRLRSGQNFGDSGILRRRGCRRVSGGRRRQLRCYVGCRRLRLSLQAAIRASRPHRAT